MYVMNQQEVLIGMSDPISQDCVGCSMEGKFGFRATRKVEIEERVIDNCPDAFEYLLKGASCAALHYHMEKRTRYLCDRHYEIHQKQIQSSQITYR